MSICGVTARPLTALCLTLKHCDVAVWVGGWDKKGGGLSWCVCVWCVEGHVSHPRIDNLSQTNRVPPGEQQEEQKKKKQTRRGHVPSGCVVTRRVDSRYVNHIAQCPIAIFLCLCKLKKGHILALGNRKKFVGGFFLAEKNIFQSWTKLPVVLSSRSCISGLKSTKLGQKVEVFSDEERFCAGLKECTFQS